MEELDYKTHPYSECFDNDCDECERYYCEDIHPDFCDSACEQPCWLCSCEECLKLRKEGELEMAEQLQRTFLIEGVEDHKVNVWTLEEVLREINRDSECTDEDGDVYIEGRYVMAGSPEDTVDHEKDDCYRPYDINDWEQGLYRLDYYRIIKEVPQKKEN
tara:strand:- start:99 stop:578 length:480 start_codon:yes stop_codon:yes gene_type:complete